jgi:hypothetical protein
MKIIPAIAILLSLAASTQATVEFQLKNLSYSEGDGAVLIEPDDRLSIEVKGAAGASIACTLEQLLRGDTVYQVDKSNAVTGRTTQNIETIKLLEDKRKLTGGEFAIKLPPRYGYFILRVRTLDAGGSEIAKWSKEFVRLVPLANEHASFITGYDGWAWWASYGKPMQPGQRAFLAKEGMGWVTIKLFWDQLEKTPGKFENLALLDQYIDATLKQHAKIILCLFVDQPAKFVSARPGTPEEQFKSIWEVLIKRYGDRVTAWDAFNEKDAAGNFISDVDACRIVYELKQKYCPQTKCTISLCTLPALRYLQKMLDAGAGKYLDGIAFHPYLPKAPEIPQKDRTEKDYTLLSALDEMHQLLLDHKTSGDIYLNEWNYPLNPPYMPECDENDQANFMVRATILSATRDYVKCLCLHAPFNGRLALPSYPNLTKQLGGTQFVRRIDTNDPEIFAYLFTRDATPVTAVWSIRGEKKIGKADLLKSISAQAAQPLTDARITDIYGNAVAPTEQLTLSEAPLYIEGIVKVSPAQ